MLIAGAEQVRRAYPGVPPAAVDWLLWALYRAMPAIGGGDTGTAAAQLRHDLAGYPGDVVDLERLRVPMIMTALRAGRTTTATTLGMLGMLGDERARVRVVAVGDLLAGRVWAREHGYGMAEVVCVHLARDVDRLRNLDPTGVAIVRLGDYHPRLEDTLTRLIEGGAVNRDRHAWPGAQRPGRTPGRLPAAWRR